MLYRVSIHFAGGCLQDARLNALGKPEHVDGAMYAGFGCLHRVVLVVDRASRTGQVVDLINLDIKRKSHIVTDQLKIAVVQQVCNILLRAGKKVIST